MEARQIKLLSFIAGEDKRLIIPVFQRNYDWRVDHCKQLYEDIVSLIENPNKTSHFIGSIVYISNREIDMVDLREYVIIDGQQRITSIILLLKAMYDSIKTDSEVNSQLKDKIYEYYLINKYQSKENKLRLKPMKEDNVVFRSIMENREIEKQNLKSNIFINYSFFKKELLKSHFSIKQIFEATQKLMIVWISLQRGEDDPQLIFESINSTGVSLTQADLIRNFVLMDKEPHEQEYLFDHYWFAIENNLTNELISDFVRNYLTMVNQKIPKKSDVYSEFKNYVVNKKEPIENILKELKYYSNIYQKIVFCRTENSSINNLLKKLNKLDITVSYPFLLNTFHKFEQQEIFKEELSEILNTIISYVFRRMVCELPSNVLSKIFANLSKEMGTIDKKSYIEKLYVALLRKKYSSAFPSNQEFKTNLLTKSINTFKHKNYLLEELENHNSDEIVNINDLTIEYIMPQILTSQWKVFLGKKFQDIHDMYLHRIGNLTLSVENKNLKTKTFNEKKILLENNQLRLNSRISEYELWSDIEINSRGKYLANIALNIWKYPDIQLEENLIYKEGHFTFDDDIDVTGMRPYQVEVFDEKFIVKSWREFFTQIFSILYELDKDKVFQLVDDQDFSARNSKIISIVEEDCRKAYKFNDTMYLEISLNANQILNYSKLAFEKLGVENSDIKFWVK